MVAGAEVTGPSWNLVACHIGLGMVFSALRLPGTVLFFVVPVDRESPLEICRPLAGVKLMAVCCHIRLCAAKLSSRMFDAEILKKVVGP
jgi:hypothetical protein